VAGITVGDDKEQHACWMGVRRIRINVDLLITSSTLWPMADRGLVCTECTYVKHVTCKMKFRQ
jgi:hypothetical protein